MNKIKVNETSPLAKDRRLRLQIIIDKFEEISLLYGPASAEELKNRINKIIRNFDTEFKRSLENKFNMFWNQKNINGQFIKGDAAEMDVPKFLRNYKK